MNDSQKDFTPIKINPAISVLILDKDQNSAQFLSNILKRRYEHVDIINNPDKAMAVFAGGNAYDIIITETLLTPWAYSDFLARLREYFPHQKIIALSGHNDFSILVDSIRYNVDGFILKPANSGQIIETVARIAETVMSEKQRMEAEKALQQSHEQMLTILDNLEAGVYVADMQTYEVLYANRYFKELLGDIVGQKCWESIQVGQSGPCAFCTNDKLITPDGMINEAYRWEFQNTKSGRWFEIVDKAIRWIDGRIVRLEIATDITWKKTKKPSV